MKVLRKLAFLAIIFSGLSLSGQVKIGGDPNTISNRSILELESDSLAMRVTRLSTTQRNAVSSWERGHVIYNTTDSCFQWYTGATWECLLNTHHGRKTVRIPQDDSVAIANMTNVKEGTILYNTTKECLAIYVDGTWVCITDAAVRQATGGGGRVTLWQQCGCGDTISITAKTSNSAADSTIIKNAMNTRCALILRSVNSGTQFFRLPHPSTFKDQYFCLIFWPGASGITTATLSSGLSNIVTTHWTTDFETNAASATMTITDRDRTQMMVGKLFSNGFFWFLAPGYF